MPELNSFLLSLIKNLAYLFILTGSFLGYGWIFLRLIRFPSHRIAEYILYGQAIGLGALSLLVCVIGMLRHLTNPWGWALISVGWVLLILEITFNHQEYAQTIHSIRFVRPGWFSIMMGLILIVNLLYTLLANAMVPPTGYDELAYHLAIPKIYIQNHAIVYIPYILQSNWPLNTEMLFTLSLLIANEQVARLVTWFTFILLSLALYYFGKRWFGTVVGSLAAVLATSTPMALALGGTAMVEVPLAFFTLLAIVTMIEWLEHESWQYLVLSAIFSGIAAGIKLNGVQTALILGGFMFFARMVRTPTQVAHHIKYVITFGLLALMTTILWYIKAWLHTGNPFWPFLYNIFGGRNWDNQASINLMTYITSVNLPTNIPNWLLGFWYVSFDNGNYGSFFLGHSYLLILPLSILANFLIRNPGQQRTIRYLTALILAFYSAWFLQTHQTRFMMIFIGPLALWGASGFGWLQQILHARWRVFSQIMIVAYFLAISWIANPTIRSDISYRWQYLASELSRSDFLSLYLPGYKVFEFANKELPTNALVLMAVWESRGYLLNRDYMWANPISQRAIRLDSFRSPEEFAAELRKLGFTHLILTHYNLYRFPYPDNRKVADLTISAMARFGKLLYQNGDVELYRLKP